MNARLDGTTFSRADRDSRPGLVGCTTHTLVSLGCACVLLISSPLTAAGRFPSTSELVSQYELPDPLVLLDGRRIATPQDWLSKRRPELIALFQHYMYGLLPPAPKQVVGNVERVDRNAFGRQATLKEVTVTFGSPPVPPIHLMLVLPNRRTGPAPVVLSMNYFGNHSLVKDPAVPLSTNWMPARGEGVVNNQATEASRGTWADIWRIKYLRQINDAFPHWFNARFKEFNDHPDRLPFDQHCLVALCAPRPVLFTNGRDDTWINPEGQFEVLRAAAPVYQLLGAGDLAATSLPADGQLIDSELGYFLRPGGHSLKPEDWRAFLDFADEHLGSPARPRSKSASAGKGATRARDDRETDTETVEVARWETHEFELHGPCRVENPFRDAALIGEFASPSGRTNRISGFYDGDDAWRLRFAPDEEGEWRYRLHGEGVEVSETGRLRCTAARGHGFLRIHPENPYAFAYADGTPFFPMGDTCYGLHDDSHVTPELRREYLDTRRRQRFNFVRMSIGHSEFRAEADPAFWAWGGTPTAPDLDRFNPVFFRGLDGLFRDLQARGMNVELLLLNFYRRPFTDTRLWTPARERLWLRYVVARYGAFNNLFLWTLANEYETHPDGTYRLDYPADVDWAKATAHFVKELDPYDHLVTVHPVISSSTRGGSPRDPIDPPWRIGGFFGEGDAFDVISQQTGQWGEGVTWDERLQCWMGDDPDLVASLRADRRFGKPVLNTENGYEYLRGHPTERRQVHHTDKVRRSAWRIVCAGGYFAAGFNGTIGHSDIWNRIDAPNRYPFTVRDEGAAKQLGTLHDFFAALPFWRMHPFEGATGSAVVASAESGQVYVVYLPRGGALSLDLRSATGRLTGRWFNPRDGRFGEPFGVPAGQGVDLTAPDGNDWTLVVQR